MGFFKGFLLRVLQVGFRVLQTLQNPVIEKYWVHLGGV